MTFSHTMRATYFSLAALLYAGISRAAEINPNLPGDADISESGPVGIVANFYQFAFMIGGLLAFGAIVYGGIRWTLAGGNPSAVSDAKAWISSAILGLLLLLGAYLILNVINPGLIQLKIEGMEGAGAKVGVVNEGQEDIPLGPSPSGPPDGNFEYDNNNIKTQLLDASAPLKSLLVCMGGIVPGGVGRISSISDSKITPFREKSFDECKQGGQAVGCAHGKNSCHYGGRCSGGSYAVDFGDQENAFVLAKAAATCTGGAAIPKFEGTHLHISLGKMNSCGCFDD